MFQQEATVAYEENAEVAVGEPEAVAPVPEMLNHEPIPQPEPPIGQIESLTIEAMPPVQMEPPREQPLPPEQIYYQQQQQQPPRPITEMLGTGSFFFLQVSNTRI